MSTTQELLAAKERYDALVRRIEELAEAWAEDSRNLGRILQGGYDPFVLGCRDARADDVKDLRDLLEES